MDILSIVIAALVALGAGYCVYVFLNRPTNEQISHVKEWLLYAVAKAEKELGSGTGQLKLRYVYDMFIAKFPHFARFVGFSAFSGLVDEALEVFKEMLQQNKDIAKYVGGEEDNG